MKLILFSKSQRERSVPELIALAHEAGLDGYDLCVRPEYLVNPDNVATALPEAARLFRAEGLDVPLVTGNFDLLGPDSPSAEPILAAMEAAAIPFLKLGYFEYHPEQQAYWPEVDRVRRVLEAWEEPARRHAVCITYHTHSHRCLGVNCAALMHLLQGRDPACLGAYLDPAHMLVEGEEWAVGVAMVREYLRLVALKDVRLTREEKNGHGHCVTHWVAAGEGMVDWTAVFDELLRIGFDGPLSVHCELEVPPEELHAAVLHEARFFRAQLDAASNRLA